MDYDWLYIAFLAIFMPLLAFLGPKWYKQWKQNRRDRDGPPQ